MSTLLNDIKYGSRQLRKYPGFTAIAVVTLALGLGVNTSVFSVINTVLLRPLPFADPERLVQVSVVRERATFIPKSIVSYPDFADWRQHTGAFDELAAYTGQDKDLIVQGLPENLSGLAVSQGFFRVLGAQAQWGRTFIEGEDQPGTAGAVILAHSLWKRLYAGDVKALGQTVQLDDEAFTIVGVLGQDFPYHLIENPNFVIPLRDRMPRHEAAYTIIGRLRDGLSLARAKEQFKSVVHRLHEQENIDIVDVDLTPLAQVVTGSTQRYLLALLGATGFVLLVACVNLANLMLARLSTRQKEMAVRQSLGAGWLRIAQQLLTESLLLASLGGAVGALLAWCTIDLLCLHLERIVPRTNEIHLDGNVMGFALVLTFVTGMLVAVIPILRLRHVGIQSLLGDRLSTNVLAHRWSDALVVFEISSALILLMGAGLMIRTVYCLTTVHQGFDAAHRVSFRVRLPESRYADLSRRQTFCRQVVERLNGLPGVNRTAMSNMIPYGNMGMYVNIRIPGRSAEQGGNIREVGCNVVTSDYLAVLGIPLLSGRAFDPYDFSDKARTVMINQRLAQTCWPDEDPLGQHMRLGWTDDVYEIVGVVGNNIQGEPSEDLEVKVYLPYGSDITDQYCGLYGFVIHTHGNPTGMIAPIRAAMREVDPALPLQRLAPVTQHISRTIRQERFTLISLSIFAGLALIMVAIGVYGVVSNLMTQRTHEIGIRMAVGASCLHITNMVLKRGAILAIIGSALGVVGAIGLTRFLSSYLYETTPTDPITFVSAVIIMVGTTLLACFIPAHRAAKLDPMEALRYE